MKGNRGFRFGLAAGFAALILCTCMAVGFAASAEGSSAIAGQACDSDMTCACGDACPCGVACPCEASAYSSPSVGVPGSLAEALAANMDAGGSVYHAEVYGGPADGDGAIVLTLLSKDLRSGKDIQIVMRPANGSSPASAEVATGRYFRPVALAGGVERPIAEAIAAVQRE